MRVALAEANIVAVQFGNIGAHGPRGLTQEPMLYGPDNAVIGSARATFMRRLFAVEFLDFDERHYCTAGPVTLHRPKAWHITGPDDTPIGYMQRKARYITGPDDTSLGDVQRVARRFTSPARPLYEVMPDPDCQPTQAPLARLYRCRPTEGNLVTFELRDSLDAVVARVVRRAALRPAEYVDYVWTTTFTEMADRLHRVIGLATTWVLCYTTARPLSWRDSE